MKPHFIYQIFVRSFSDANQDGIGDLKGISQKLDYLAYLGVDAVWLSPVFSSPSYHKYDVVDYYSIDPEYGSMEDFEELLQNAQSKNIKIILDLPIGHTGHQHPWFLEAVSSQENAKRDFYIWKIPKEIKALNLESRKASADTGIVNPWHKIPGQKEQYYGVFSSQMPGLNYENEAVFGSVLEVADFWMKKGVYGFRLDAAKHVFPHWEPVQKSAAFWQKFKTELEKKSGPVFLLGEVWDVPENIAPFFEGLDACFDFELCYAIRDALIFEEDKKNLVESQIKTEALYAKVNPDFTNAIFIGNHDMERITSTLKGYSAKIMAAFNLLFTLPGQVVVYYGDEIATEGRKPDKSLREPFIWNYRHSDYFRTEWVDGKFSNERRLFPLSVQSQDENSIFSHFCKMAAFRKKQAALSDFSSGSLKTTGIIDKGLISFFRENSQQKLLILQNISAEQIETAIDFTGFSVLLVTRDSAADLNRITLEPFGLVVIEIRPD